MVSEIDRRSAELERRGEGERVAEYDRRSRLSGLTEGEAREFNRFFVLSFCVFVGIAIIAHILVWWWRPWLPGVNGYQTSFLDGVGLEPMRHAVGALMALV